MIDYSIILTINYQGSHWCLNGDSYNDLIWLSDTPKPTQKELDALWPSTQKKLAQEFCKKKAKHFLNETDWSALPDVDLINQADFIAYRKTIRNYIINPVADPVWPVQPKAQWSK